MINITLFSMRCERNRVDKFAYMDIVKELQGDFRTSIDVMSPSVVFDNDALLDYNYVFIKELNRYYFVTSTTILNTGSHMVSLHEDVLMSHKDAIIANDAFILRNENDFNKDLNDPLISAQLDYISTQMQLTESMTFYNYNREHSIVLVGVK